MSRTAPTPVPQALVSDFRSLRALIETTTSRQPVPCTTDTPPRSWWTSDVPAELEAAAIECRACSIRLACRAYGLKHMGEHGTYGGLTPNQRKEKHKNA